MSKAKNKILTVKIPINIYEAICRDIIESNTEQLKELTHCFHHDNQDLHTEIENEVNKFFNKDRLQKSIEETIFDVVAHTNSICEYMPPADELFPYLYEKLVDEIKRRKEALKLEEPYMINIPKKNYDKAYKILQAAGLL